MAACRLYALALELIHDRPDISYQLLISSVETIANGVLRSFQPSDEAKLEHQEAVYDVALRLQLGDDAAKKLAIEACKRGVVGHEEVQAVLEGERGRVRVDRAGRAIPSNAA